MLYFHCCWTPLRFHHHNHSYTTGVKRQPSSTSGLGTLSSMNVQSLSLETLEGLHFQQISYCIHIHVWRGKRNKANEVRFRPFLHYFIMLLWGSFIRWKRFSSLKELLTHPICQGPVRGLYVGQGVVLAVIETVFWRSAEHDLLVFAHSFSNVTASFYL